MTSKRFVIILLVVCCAATSAQRLDETALARELSDTSTRSKAIDQIVALSGSVVPLLLSWTQTAPPEVNQYELDIGLADVFGQLRTREAIPFLIKNIGLNRDHRVNVWTKAPEVIEVDLPAAAALVKIGPAAARAIIQAYWQPIPGNDDPAWQPVLAEDRPAAIFVVTRVLDASPKAVPEARAFLQSALAYLNIERRWAEDGLKLLDKKN